MSSGGEGVGQVALKDYMILVARSHDPPIDPPFDLVRLDCHRALPSTREDETLRKRAVRRRVMRSSAGHGVTEWLFARWNFASPWKECTSTRLRRLVGSHVGPSDGLG